MSNNCPYDGMFGKILSTDFCVCDDWTATYTIINVTLDIFLREN